MGGPQNAAHPMWVLPSQPVAELRFAGKEARRDGSGTHRSVELRWPYPAAATRGCSATVGRKRRGGVRVRVGVVEGGPQPPEGFTPLHRELREGCVV